MDKAINPWVVRVALGDVPETGLHVELEAPPAIRAALASAAALRDLPELTAVFDVTRRGAGLRVSGRVKARAGQTCVVTLEPIENAIDEEVDVLFSPDAPVVPEGGEPTHHQTVGHSGDDAEPPEPLIGGAIDLGGIATEFLMLAIDPYPRKPSVEFVPPPRDTEAEHPFAALAALKKPSETGGQ
jgi:hypothetical protein